MKIAVIIPTCGRSTLKRAIKSALAQKKPFAKIIVVNDSASTIDCLGGPRLVTVETSGSVGPTKGRRMAVDTLGSDIQAVCYLDDDDELLPNHAKLLSEKLEEGADFAFSKALYRYPDGFETEDPEPGNKNPNKAYYDPNALLRQNIAPVSSFIHTRKAYEAVGGWDAKLPRMEDWDLWGRMFINFGPPAKVDAVTNVIYKGLGANRTDSNQFVYAMACHWRDYVEAKLRTLNNIKNAKTETDRHMAEAVLNMIHIPKVSVVMPVYNAEPYLQEALWSLENQTFEDFEVVAVNDGSTDQSHNILCDFRDGMNGLDVRIFDLPTNQGVTKALNYGLLMSRTEYVARMDADDVCEPERLAKQVDFLDKNKHIGILGSRFWSMNHDLTCINWANEVPTGPEEIKKALLDHCCIGHPTVMMRRKVIETIGGYDEGERYQAVEDYELWLRASRLFKIANLPDYLLKYREYGGQVTKKLSEARQSNFEYVRDKYRRLEAEK